MKEPIDLQTYFELYRQELGYSFIACLVAVCRQWMAGHPFRFVVCNGLICAAVAFGIDTVLNACGISGGTWGYMASVFVGYVGVESFFAGLADRLPFFPKKPGG